MSKQSRDRLARSGLSETVVVTLLLAVALGMRLIAIDHLPPGLYRDEALNGLDAWRVLQGETPLFFEANNGREPLFIYLLALGVRAWGCSPGALRVVAAAIGTLTIPSFYWLGRELYGRRIALIAAVIAACNVWMLNLSRIVFRAGVMLPLLACGLGALWRGLARRQTRWMLIAGIFFGASIYTYLAARLTAVALLLWAAKSWQRERTDFWLAGWLTMALTATLVAAPLLIYWLGSMEQAAGRVGQVSIFSPDMREGPLLQALVVQGWRTLLGFFWRGDFIPRHNIPLQPFIAPAYAMAMLLGIVVGLRQAQWRRQTWLCLSWLGVMLVPTWLAEGAPHMLRASGILPVLFLLPALGLDTTERWLRERRQAGVGAMVALTLIMAATSAGNLADYARHLQSEDVYYNFEAGAAALAVDVNQFLGSGWQGQGLRAKTPSLENQRVAYVAQRLWEGWPSLRYLCADQDNLRVYRPGMSPEMITFDQNVLLALWPFEPMDEALALLPEDRVITVQEGARERQDLASKSQLLYVTLRTDPIATAPVNADAAWEHGIRLRGYAVTVVDERYLVVSLYWQAQEPVAVDYAVFVHATSQDGILGQHDGPAALGYYGTSRWRPGDMVRDDHHIVLDQPWSDQAEIKVGLYAWPTMENVRRIDASGRVLQDDTLSLAIEH